VTNTNRLSDVPPRNGADDPAPSLLDRAVERGIITAAQREAIAALAREGPETGADAHAGVNAVTVAYWAGALVVLFALAWFLVDRWRNLGAGGVLAVSAGYALLFVFLSHWLVCRDLRLASSIVTLLVVALVPVMTWAVLDLTGLWYDVRPGTPPPVFYRPTMAEMTRWIPVDVATIVAALVAMRWRRFGILVVPAAIGFWYLMLHVVPLIAGASLSRELEGSTILVVGTTLLAIGYALDRRPRSAAYAGWLYMVGLAAMIFAGAERWGLYKHVVPHVALVLSILSVALSLALGRRSFLIAGAIGFVSYLAWLAFDVFRRAVSFPIVLAAFGVAIILAAVWVQRRYPALSRRMAARRAAGGASVPGGLWGWLAAVAIALVLFAADFPSARQREVDRARREREMIEGMRRDSIRAGQPRDSLVAVPKQPVDSAKGSRP
jgi:hypothetical protein